MSANSKPVSLVVKPRGAPIKGLPDQIAITLANTGTDLYNALAQQSKFSVHRLRITKGSDQTFIPNGDNFTINDTGLRNMSAIFVKDLGPQIAWRTVFIVEYIGPILIHPFFYFLRPYIYKNPNPLSTFPPPSTLQTYTLYMVLLHFAKREFETLFIHRFSLATMPVRNIFKNSLHYWALSGLLMAYFIYSPTSRTASPSIAFVTYPAIALFLLAEAANFSTHLTLRNLRKPGSTERGIPRGFGFNLVTCPNYYFEILAWVAVLLVTRSWTTLVFLAGAAAQMGEWAVKKERRYRQDFGDKYKKKKYVMIPYVY